MNDRNDYKIRGKRHKLIPLKEELRAYNITCWHSTMGGFIRVEIHNGAELNLLQDICIKLGLTYELF